MRAVSSPKHRDPQIAGSPKLSSRVSDSQNAGHVDGARLLRAIQALDEDAVASVTTSAWKICEAFGFFLELLLQWEQSAKQSLAARAHLTTIWEARIFSCLKRFVAKKKHADFKFVGCSCPNSSDGGDVPCVQRLVCYTLVVIIFMLARDPRMASAVVKNELHGLLFELFFETQGHQSKDSEAPISTVSNPNAQASPEIVDARDLLLALDPFDWCFQSTCIQITADEEQQQKKRDAVFLIPVGIRSLVYLLAGEALPSDEITEYDTKLRRHPSGGDLYRAPQASLAKKKRRLPSIFTFPTDADPASKSSQDIARAIDSDSICSRKYDPAFVVVRSHSAIHHMALRAAVTLLQNLRRPSPERKLLLSGGDCIQMLLLHDCSFPDQHTIQSQDGGVSTVGLLSCQKVAMEPRMLGQIAQCGLTLLHDDEVDAFLKKQPQLSQQLARPPDDPPVPSSTSRPTATMKTPRKTKAQKKPAADASLSLAERLQAAREESRHEIAANHPLSPLKKEFELERSLRRQQLRSQCESLEQLRAQLSQSLVLLHNGRPHADPAQSFTSWIASLPTIEKKEQEKRSNELMRQQYAIEMQFHRDEARKQRLRECTMMQQNDSDALSETEHDRKEQRRLEFLRMHEEMQLLQEQQQREGQRMIGGNGDLLMQYGANDQDDDQQVNEIEARMLHAETLSAQRKARQKKLHDEQTRLLWVRQRKQEAKELERMTREDLYYVEKLLRAKQLELEQREQAQLSAKRLGNPIEEQQRKIERMRQLDLERRLAEKESERMRTEDLVARQLRYVETERRHLEGQQEKLARKHMEGQERECRLLWTRLELEQKKIEEQEAKRLRLEARRLQKMQLQYEAQVLAAWTESWDEYGNVYYYNTVTGVSRWESPFTTLS